MLKRVPLHQLHVELGAKFTEFSGYELPLSYRRGAVAEHMACREAAALFDVSHLGSLRLEGKGSYERLQHELSNDLSKIAPGRAQYSLLLDEKGNILDDLILWWLAPEKFEVICNAANVQVVAERLGARDETQDRALLALQGPEATELACAVIEDLKDIERFEVRRVRFEGKMLTAAATGYTGERGVELSVDLDLARGLFERFLELGAVPAGLAARDSLRLEAGLYLWGNDLRGDTTPLEAGLSWAVGWGKDFVGKDCLLKQREGGLSKRLLGIKGLTRQPLRAGWHVMKGEVRWGELRSGGWSPVLKVGIGIAKVSSRTQLGDAVEVGQGGRLLSATVVKPPFVRSGLA